LRAGGERVGWVTLNRFDLGNLASGKPRLEDRVCAICIV
jgi:hypothetical protein